MPRFRCAFLLMAWSSALPGWLPAQRLVPVPVAPAAATLDFALGYPPPLAVLPSGCAATFDEGAHQVVCVDLATGKTSRVGRDGVGPGEFRSVARMMTQSDGGLIAYDVITSRVTEIAPDWTVHRMARTANRLTALMMANADSVLGDAGPPHNAIVEISLNDGGTTTLFDAVDSAHADLFHGVPPFYFDGGLWIAANHAGGWIVAAPFTYRILIEDRHGSVVKIFGRDLPPTLPAEPDLDRMKRLMPGAGPAILDRLAHTPMPQVMGPPVEDSHERIWILTSRVRRDSTEVDLFDRAGTFLGTQGVPGEALAMTIRNDELYFVSQHLGGDADGEDGVLRYRIE